MKYPYENKNNPILSFSDMSRHNLQADCENCFGFCCVALYFSASEGFPVDKDAGKPCINLQSDFRCSVHKSLRKLGLKGCIAYDCFGAGQKVAQVTYGGHDWRQVPKSAKQMYEVFLIMRQIHEMLWYLAESLTLQQTCHIQGELSSMLNETERLTLLSPDSLIELDVAAHRGDVNTLLLQTSELVRSEVQPGQKTSSRHQKTLGRGLDLIGANLRKNDLRGANLRGAYLIAADLRGVDLSGADLIGADLRDADLRGANLTHSIFLTQAQINTAKGDSDTKLPISLTRPIYWSK
ncbi:pentapeptide repeat-containing protein [Clostridium pasteurianum]|uniref:Putative low-complexity protein n=1 Tax=Clostridium pasteurianum BC1 TaxID=86416 RepID=R4KFY0_CLOPA|nr:pentapeptide repeat-containing protein [Clostridium pasteurianum]AGK99459.1 putative low-complexity protein [Clostridium pasteurianum BC1]